jgi:diacylglycerol kinase family enzyme
MKFRNIHVVINLGLGKLSVDLDMIRSRLGASHAAFRIALIEPDSGPEALARRAILDGADLVIAAGGEGTELGTAEGLIGKEVSLGVISQGIENVFAAEMGLP